MKNRERLLAGDIAAAFFQEVVGIAKQHDLLSDEHFTVDGTLIEAWAGQKSFKKKEGSEIASPPDDPSNPTVDFHAEKRSNQTHESTTDPEARLYKKSKGSEAKLAYLGHVLMENRNGLLVDAVVTQADGTAERDAAFIMAARIPGAKPVTLGADKNYDTRQTVREWRQMAVRPHVAQNDAHRRSAIDGRTTGQEGYRISQRKRKRIEESFGWMKMIGLLRKVKLRGRRGVEWMFTWTAAAYNLVRIRNLIGARG